MAVVQPHAQRKSHARGEACGEGRWWLAQPHMQRKETKTKKGRNYEEVEG